jgi:hypothetical protein
VTPHLVILKPDGETLSYVITRLPTAEELLDLIGGWITEVPGFTSWAGSPCVAYCDEDGDRQNLPKNMLATKAWMKVHPEAFDILTGTVVLVVGPHDFLHGECCSS